jgi:hypothetical protein
MGKHERDWVEVAEQAVTAGLNGLPQSSYIDDVVKAIQSKVGSSYDHAVWTGGNDYKNPGDVHVVHHDKTISKVELKFSRAKGAGTAKNISSKILQKQVAGDIKDYPKYDEELGLKTQRFDLVENRIGRKLTTDTDYKNQLRQFRDAGDPIIEQIANITSPGQEQYAQYAADKLNQHLDKVNSLVNKLLSTDPVDVAHQDVLYCVIKNFESDKQTVEFFDFTDMDKVVTKVEASGKSIKFYNQSSKDVVRFSVTWKNICQGGSTPCFNVFVGNAHRH